uniref:Cytochrome c oxidase subunit 2 n=1 Tax=Crenicichla regani TaxID=81338 RepID=A0A1C8DXG2_9CICH|nr:cytochrome c oxidase subunit II [Crenicichla regani]
MSNSFQLGFQNAAAPVMEEFIYFYDLSTLVVVFISVSVFLMMTSTLHTELTNKTSLDSPQTEAFWTLVPVAVLGLIAFPSMRILYILEEDNNPHLTVKAIGHQWYWSYEYPDYDNLAFDSYMVPTQDLAPGQYRLLEADHRMVFPINSPTRVLISAEDVLHSWAVPSLGVKMDAVPGRLNQIILFASRIGVFYGQCSEICGANHSFMPVVTEVTLLEPFENWVSLMLGDA